ncbi:MAG: hypothetical protein IT331_20770 [Anaerolineae bacterium]|nr:hypothetical protein [Anaerolineae bacterium]
MLEEFESVAKKLEADFEATQRLTHSGVKGQAREKEVARNFLQPYLPSRYSIGTGLVVDSKAETSRQQDLVIFDRFNSPTLQDHGDNQIFFAEQVFAAIEVKSKINKVGLDDLFVKAQSLAKLEKRTTGIVSIAPGFNIATSTPPVAVFGFAYQSSIALESARDYLQSASANKRTPEWPIAILLLRDPNNESGVIVSVDASNIGKIQVLPTDEMRFGSVKTSTPGKALLYFYFILMARLQVNGLAAPPPDFQQYARAAGLGDPELSIGVDSLKGTRIEWKGAKVEIDDTIRMRDLLAKLSSNSPMPDDEIFELFWLSQNIIQIDAGFRDGTIFLVDGQPWLDVSPNNVNKGLKEWRLGIKNSMYWKDLTKFVDLIRFIRSGSSFVEIRELTTDTQLFGWKGPVKK